MRSLRPPPNVPRRNVIAPRSLPVRSPVLAGAVLFLLFDRFGGPWWLWGPIAFGWFLLWLYRGLQRWMEKPIDLWPKDDPARTPEL